MISTSDFKHESPGGANLSVSIVTSNLPSESTDIKSKHAGHKDLQRINEISVVSSGTSGLYDNEVKKYMAKDGRDAIAAAPKTMQINLKGASYTFELIFLNQNQNIA